MLEALKKKALNNVFKQKLGTLLRSFVYKVLEMSDEVAIL